MPQNTNLNVNPYFDDFDKDKNFSRVLFKPGVPVQARELSTLQSILQNQVEQFGKHFFKEGSVVIPGSVAYDPNFHAVKIEQTFFGVPVELYYENIIGKTIKGKSSGITAIVKKVLPRAQSIENQTTIYVKYLKSSEQDFGTQQFLDGENLLTLEDFTYGTTTIENGSDFATCIATNATDTGSAFSVTAGVFFARGTFISVTSETLLLDQYSNSPSYRVGFFVKEEVVTAVDDESLYDNAAGYNNYTSPGADRFKISLSLFKKDLQDFQDENFIELFRVREGQTRKLINTTIYNELAKELARRTYDESGDYYVRNFDLYAKESLNDRHQKFGVYYKDEVTDQGNNPSYDLMEIQVGPGKAYVRGFEVENLGNQFIDVPKPRTTGLIEQAAVPFQAGNMIHVNNCFGAPQIGLATDDFIDLRDERLGSTKSAAAGISIGRARVYDFKSNAAAYADDSSVFDLYLFDVQTDTKLTLNQAVTVNTPAVIEGKSSGARGYLRNDAGGVNDITLHQISGSFIEDEQITINGVNDGRTISEITEYDVSSIKSVRSDISGDIFAADTELVVKHNFGAQGFTITAASGSESTVTSGVQGWKSHAKVGDIVAYQSDGGDDIAFNRVKAISATGQSLTVEAVESVSSVCLGALPTSALTGVNLQVMGPRFDLSKSAYLYADMPREFIESIDLTSSDIFVRKTEDGLATNSQGVLDLPSLSGGDFVYAAFDEERYVLHYSDGSIEPLTPDQFTMGANAKSATISGLTASQTAVEVIVTLQKGRVSSKTKTLKRCQSLVVNKSKYNHSGITTGITDGLDFNPSYGLRVQDNEISLNVPDVIKVHGVFESSGPSDATVPSLVLNSLNGPNANVDDVFVGEIIVGKKSGASAIVVAKTGTSQIFIINKNKYVFKETEDIEFLESGVTGNVGESNLGDRNILNAFTLDNGQRTDYYDFARLIRKRGQLEPSKRLTIFYDVYVIDSLDNGDIITVNSYGKENYEFNVPSFQGRRNTDILDFRPRVATYTGSKSPFEFEARDFSAGGQIPNVIVSDENCLFDYNYYQPRIDRLYVNKNKTFTVNQGEPSDKPVAPEKIDTSFELATIVYKPYVIDVTKDVVIQLKANRRYTMKDIGGLEDRIENLEYYTSLSLLESKTESLLIQDPDTGLDRFKSGFVVDNFDTKQLSDTEPKHDVANGVLVPQRYFDTVDLLVGSESLIGATGTPDLSVDPRFAQDLGSPNITKDGNNVMLSYTEAEDRVQPFASRVENINPYTVFDWKGMMTLNPASDVFIRSESVSSEGGFGFNNTTITTERNITDMRSQNIAFTASRLKPGTEHFASFSNVDLSGERALVIPKYLEVTPVQGAFQIGETIIGKAIGTQDSNSIADIRFRLAQPNHKDGSFNAPSLTLAKSPYSDTALASSYSDTSTILNIDINSLNQKSDERFYGFVTVGMQLVGETTGAEATISAVRLISDSNGALLGSIHLPPDNPSFENGTNTAVLVSTKANDKIPGRKTSSAAANFTSRGTLVTETTIVRTAPPPPPPPIIIIITPPAPPEPEPEPPEPDPEPEQEDDDDPLAQSFQVEEPNGIFMTSVDLYFQSKGSTAPVELRIVTLENGTPTRKMMKNASVTLEPEAINISNDASVLTNFKFPNPIYLPSGEYAFVIITTTDEYNLWISQVGEEDIKTRNLPELQKVIIDKQPTLGSLFKAQNASTWTASQLEDLKYTSHKAKFVTETAAFRLYNPELRTFGDRNRLKENPIDIFSKRITLGLTSSITYANNPDIVVGTQIKQENRSSTGFVERLNGPMGLHDTGINITKAGIGYSAGAYGNVNFITKTGSGTGAVGIVTVASGGITEVCVTNSGTGYNVGDTLTAELGTTGANSVLTVGLVTATNQLVLANCEGVDFNSSDQIQYVVESSGVTNTLTSIVPATINVNSDEFDGTHFKVSHDNHGMHAENNRVEIIGVSGDSIPTKITAGYAVSSTDAIGIGNSMGFNFFEGAQVEPSNPGFAIIGDEILAYTGVALNTLTGITTRGIDGSIPRTYNPDTPIQKYEAAGISLRKINTEHLFTNVTNNIVDKINLDSYVLKIDGDKTFTTNYKGGGTDVRASQNIQYDSLTSFLNYSVPDGTEVSGQVRTTSATSVSGSEGSFNDNGYQAISLNGETIFSKPQMVASRVNELAKLDDQPGGKSFTLEVSLSTTDENVSPVVNVFESYIATKSHRVNAPITDYTLDKRVNLDVDDPHDYNYVTKTITLENPATSLKVLMGAYRPADSEIRVLYRLQRVDGSEIDKVFSLFPGYDNMDVNGKIISAKSNSGLPDRNISPSLTNQFTEYEWSVNDLPQFSGFQVKVECISTNQADPIQVIDFRTIALA